MIAEIADRCNVDYRRAEVCRKWCIHGLSSPGRRLRRRALPWIPIAQSPDGTKSGRSHEKKRERVDES